MTQRSNNPLLNQSLGIIQDQLASVQLHAIHLARQLENYMAPILEEGLSIPARGASAGVKTLGQFSALLGEGLVLITGISETLAALAENLAKSNRIQAETSQKALEKIGPHFYTLSEGLEKLGNKISKLSEPLVPGHFKECVSAFGQVLTLIGRSAKGVGEVIRLSSKVNADAFAPVAEKLTSICHRFFEGVHSVAESIREYSESLHRHCDKLSTQVNFKPHSKANQKLDALASSVAEKASSLVWSFLLNSKPMLQKPEEALPLSKKPKAK